MKPDATPRRGTEVAHPISRKTYEAFAGGQQRDDECAMLWLKRRIEELGGDQVMWSRSAYTHRRTPHVAFVNGHVKVEGEPSANEGVGVSVFDLAAATYEAVKAYRNEVSEAHVGQQLGLVWRIEPEISREGAKTQIYVRLCFEPLAQASAA